MTNFVSKLVGALNAYIVILSIITSFAAMATETKVDRYALVIGNSNYQVSPLDNAVKDANDVTTILTDIGFDVTSVYDASALDLQASVKQFYTHIKNQKSDQSLALVYYAGHAIQIEHSNYLVPVNVEFGSKELFMADLFNINKLFGHIATFDNIQTIIILDACRNNPFNIDSVSISNGLAPLEAPTDTLIAYATEPGGIASDGMDDNGVYTKHLLRHIKQEISVEEMFKKVRKGVARETRRKQIPWEHSSLLRDVYINPPLNKDIPDLIAF